MTFCPWGIKRKGNRDQLYAGRPTKTRPVAALGAGRQAGNRAERSLDGADNVDLTVAIHGVGGDRLQYIPPAQIT